MGLTNITSKFDVTQCYVFNTNLIDYALVFLLGLTIGIIGMSIYFVVFQDKK